MEEKLVVFVEHDEAGNCYVVANDTRVSGFYRTRSECWEVADRLLRRWGVTLPSFGETSIDGVKRRGVVKRYVFSWNEKVGKNHAKRKPIVNAMAFEATTELKARELLRIALGRKRCPRGLTTREHVL